MYSDSIVEAVEVVRAADHQDAVVLLHAVDFVEEVASHGVGHDAVEVFEHEVAGGFLACFLEDLVDCIFGAGKLGYRQWLYCTYERW